MAGYHGITGWSGGGRRPLTYNLMPGQMRSTRVNVFQSNYIMPMATCYYAEPHCHCEDSGMPKWMQWMMGIGMGSQLLGGIMSGIFGGGGSTEGAGGASKKDVDAELDLRQLKTDYKNYTFSRYSDGTVRARDKSGKVVAQGDSPLELRDALDELASKNTESTSTISPQVKELAGSLGITITNDNPPKYKFGDKEYSTLAEAVNAAKDKSNQTAPTQVTTTTAPKLFNDVSDKTAEQVLADFKHLTGADAVKIEDIGNGGITITNLHDDGTIDKAGSITISKEQLNKLTSQMGATSLGQYAGQKVYAENLDGYLRIKVGSQTYIVGKASDNKYTGYQFENGNVVGYKAKNPELSGG